MLTTTEKIEEAKALERERVLQRFEGDDPDEQDLTSFNLYDTDTYPRALTKENKLLKDLYAKVYVDPDEENSAHEKITLTSSKDSSKDSSKLNSKDKVKEGDVKEFIDHGIPVAQAARFFSIVAKNKFWGKKNTTITAKEIHNLLSQTRRDRHDMYTLDALKACCYNHKNSQTRSKGEETSDIELEKMLKLDKDQEFEFRT